MVLGLEPKRVWGLWGLSGRCGSSCESLGGAAAVQAQGQALPKDPPPAVAIAGPIGREGVPAHILGARVTFVPGRRTPSHVYSDRIAVRCCNAGHPGCGNSRSLQLMHDRFGARCAEAFLGAWLLKAESVDAGRHSRGNPSVAEMEAFLAAHP